MSGYIGNIPVPQATQTRQSFTATASQTTFNTAGYSPGYIDVFLNGVKLAPADYTATNGSDVVLAVGAASNDILEIVAYEIFQVVDQAFTGNFSVDSPTFVVDSTNNRVGIGTASPAELLNLSSSEPVIRFTDSDDGNYHHLFSSSDDFYISADRNNTGSGNLIFRNGGTSERMRITSDGSVGIGTSSPNSRLTLSTGDKIFVPTGEALNFGHTDGSTNTERMRIDASGQVGIGTSSPSGLLHLTKGIRDLQFLLESTPAAGDVGVQIRGGSGDYIGIASNTGIGIVVDSSNNVGIGTTSPSERLEVARIDNDNAIARFSTNNATADIFLESSEGQLRLRKPSGAEFAILNNSNAERMRIDSSGNLLVGKTSTAFGSVGARLSSTDNHFTTNGGAVADFNRLTSDGAIANFYKDGANVGNIGSVIGARLRIDSNSTAGYLGIAGTNRYYWNNTELGVISDNAYNLGSSGARFKDLYLSGGVYLGGTGAANKLDDYEEGTFTPVVRGRSAAGTGTYTRQSGWYTKVGRTVTIHMDIGWSAHTGSGGMEITLPFATGSGYQAGGFMSYNSGMTYGASAGDILSLWMDSSSTNMRVFYYNRTGVAATVNVPSSAGEIHLHMIYNT